MISELITVSAFLALLFLAPIAIPGNEEPITADIRENLTSQLPHLFGKCMGLTNQQR